LNALLFVKRPAALKVFSFFPLSEFRCHFFADGFLFFSCSRVLCARSKRRARENESAFSLSLRRLLFAELQR